MRSRGDDAELEGTQAAVGIEGLPGENAGTDQAALAARQLAQIAGRDQLAGGIREEAGRTDARARIAGGDALVLQIVGADHEMAAAIGELDAGRSFKQVFLGIAARGNTGLRAELEALLVIVQQDVDDAGDCPRSIGPDAPPVTTSICLTSE
ncbi:hypothetical protein DdX_20389 [Ditylenchus destructor]|uniref:Uncharacterized protein n=1 Tax=Ditylenchus destructor TaxID=166010 RepID=A0AAD4MKV8_9BILA|nr:hypothetical protein DdX_20389 [Ditylenchus destructor]